MKTPLKSTLLKKVVLGIIVAAAMVAFTSASWAESGCHDRGARGPVTVAGK